MKKSLVLFALLLITSISFGQKKDKIKGSKIVTIEQKKIESFTSLEVSDNIEVLLVKGTECALEIEADDNLHDAIDIAVSGSTLRLSTLKNILSAKKLSVRLTYTDDFKLVVAKGETKITALTDIEIDDFTFRSSDYAKLFINAKNKNFTLECTDKSKVELNLKSEKATISMSKNADLKALITAKEMIFDMYQKANATVEGDVTDLKLRLDNNANFNGKKLTVQNGTLTSEAYTNISINIKTNAIIDASGKSEIQLYGDQKIEIKRFLDSAVLMKKPTK